MTAMVIGLFTFAALGATWVRDGFRDIRGEIRQESAALRGEIHDGYATLSARVDATNARLDRVDGRIDGLTAEVHSGFAAVRADIAGLDRRLAAVEGH